MLSFELNGITNAQEKTMKTKSELKMELAGHVARKVELTRERRAYKAATPPSAERGSALRYMWSDCSTQKEQVRYTALAYAFVRGRRYWHVERDVHEQHRPYARTIAREAGVEESVIKAWLADQPSPEERIAWSAHLEATRASRLADRIELATRRKLSSLGLAS